MEKIAITIQNFVQFYSVQNFIDNYKNAEIHLFVPEAINDMGFKEMFDDIYNYLVENNYNVYRKVDMSVKYKILLEPYPMDIYMKFNYVYRIKYQYALNTSKPALIYKAESNIYYDAILCHSVYEKEVLSNFSRTYLVGKLNFIDFKKEKKLSKKKTLLYLPTYGNLNSIDTVANELKKISSKYDIIVKEHHGTNYLNYEIDKKNKLYSNFKRVYDSTVSLNELLKSADGVLSDSSGAIFDSLYANVPVCIFSKNIEDCSLENLDSLQYQLVKDDVIPYTNKVTKLHEIVDAVFEKKYFNRQKKIRDELFPIKDENILNTFVEVIDKYLYDSLDYYEKEWIKLHRIVVGAYEQRIDSLLENDRFINEAKNASAILQDKAKSLEVENEYLDLQLREYKNGKLYKVATKIYSIKSKIIKRKNK